MHAHIDLHYAHDPDQPPVRLIDVAVGIVNCGEVQCKV